jgi:hypothetical protein
MRRSGPLDAVLVQGEGISGEGLADRYRWLHGHGYRMDEMTLMDIMVIGDEPQAFAVALESVLEQRADVAQLCVRYCIQSHRRRCLEVLMSRGLLNVDQFPDCDGSLAGLLHLASNGDPGLSQAETAVWLVEHTTGEGVPLARRHPLTEQVFAAAACFGSLQLLQLLRGRGCPMGEGPWTLAACGGCEAVLEWLAEVKCP